MPKIIKVTIENHIELGKKLKELREELFRICRSVEKMTGKSSYSTKHILKIMSTFEKLRSELEDDMFRRVPEAFGSRGDKYLSVYYGD